MYDCNMNHIKKCIDSKREIHDDQFEMTHDFYCVSILLREWEFSCLGLFYWLWYSIFESRHTKNWKKLDIIGHVYGYNKDPIPYSFN